MGWGPLTLYTARKRAPERALKGFSGGFASVQRVETVEWASGVYQHTLNADCGVTVYCSNCGAAMCPGCGSAPTILLTKEGPITSCKRPECVNELETRLGEMIDGSG